MNHDSRLEKLEARVATLEATLAAMRAAQASGAFADVASAAELDDARWGDPNVRRDPKRWSGRSYVGLPYSRTEPDYLDALAGFLDWCAQKERETPGKERYAKYSLRDARLARGWAARLRSGWKAPALAPGTEGYSSAGYDLDDPDEPVAEEPSESRPYEGEPLAEDLVDDLPF